MVIDSTDKLRFAVVKVRHEALVTAQHFWGLQHRCVRHWNQLIVQDELDTMLADPRITEKKMPILCDSQIHIRNYPCSQLQPCPHVLLEVILFVRVAPFVSFLSTGFSTTKLISQLLHLRRRLCRCRLGRGAMGKKGSM